MRYGPLIRNLLISANFLIACREENLVKSTFVEGKVTGVLDNVTPFSESFRFEETSGSLEGFEETSEGLKIKLVRSLNSSSTSPHIMMTLILKNAGQASESLSFFSDRNQIADEFDFLFRKETATATFSEISCKGFTQDPWFRILSIEANKKYEFVTDENGNPTIVLTKSTLLPYVIPKYAPTKVDHQFMNIRGDTIHFDAIIPYGGSATQFPFEKVIYANGTSSTSDGLYEYLVYERKTGVDCCRFFLKGPAGTTSLEEYYDIENGIGEILNYHYDFSTGYLVFNFKINISGSEKGNSTGKSITIIGNFDSGSQKIYHP